MDCQYGIHDISRIQTDRSTKLPRFNMPLELGMFLGAKASGNRAQKKKACMVLDSERYRYQALMSDIAGQDIHAHHNTPEAALKEVRKWLVTCAGATGIPGGTALWRRYQEFSAEFPRILRDAKLKSNELSFLEYSKIVSQWTKSR